MEYKTGLSYRGYTIAVMHLPDRKKPCLVVVLPGEYAIYKVASFNSEKAADWFIEQAAKMFDQKSR